MSALNLNALLDGISPVLHEQAKEKIDSGEYLDVMYYISGHQALEYVYKHREMLDENRLLEKFFANAFIRHNEDNHAYYNELDELVEMCDPDRLEAAGDPIPKGDTFKLYRGVTFLEWANGFSWTRSLKVAQWFADRYKDRYKGFVVVKDIPRHWVLFYTNARTEEEFIIDTQWLMDDEHTVYEDSPAVTKEAAENTVGT